MGHSRDGFNMYGEMETMQKHRVNVGAQNESRDKEPDFYSSCQSMFVCVPLPMCPCAHVSDFLSTGVLNCRGGGGGTVTWG